jgi:biopolymer transport protein ExbD
MLDSKKPIVTINMTPLVDVSLVLVVIFMATAPMFMQSGIIVSSAEKKNTAAAQPKPAKPEENIVIKLEGPALRLNQRPVADADLSPLLRAMLAQTTEKRVIISPEREVKHGRVIWVMDTAKQAGADTLVILGKSPTEPAAAAPAGR